MERKYGIIKASKKKFPKDEPLFLLRAQDPLAAGTVAAYACLRMAIGDHKGAQECMVTADAMRAWPKKKKRPD